MPDDTRSEEGGDPMELTSYLMSVPGLGAPARARIIGGRALANMPPWWRVITAVLAGSAIGLLTAVASEHSLAAALVAGGLVALGALAVMMRLQQSAWERATSAQISFDSDETGPVEG